MDLRGGSGEVARAPEIQWWVVLIVDALILWVFALLGHSIGANKSWANAERFLCTLSVTRIPFFMAAWFGFIYSIRMGMPYVNFVTLYIPIQGVLASASLFSGVYLYFRHASRLSLRTHMTSIPCVFQFLLYVASSSFLIKECWGIDSTAPIKTFDGVDRGSFYLAIGFGVVSTSCAFAEMGFHILYGYRKILRSRAREEYEQRLGAVASATPRDVFTVTMVA